MSEIKFIDNGYTIPLTLEVKVGELSVTYVAITGGYEFTAWTANEDKAFNAVKKIVNQIVKERSGHEHFISYKTQTLKVVECSDRYGYTIVEWKFYVTDSLCKRF